MGSPVRARCEATVNDLLLAALHVGIDRWNLEQGGATGLIAIQMPMNARPHDRSREVVGNFVFSERTTTTAEERADPASTVATIAAQTRRAKGLGPAISVVSLNKGDWPTPLWVRSAVASVMPFLAGQMMDTAVLSNLGRFDAVHLSFGSDLRAIEL